MTIYTITLFDGRTTQISADEITTRNDGSLWLLRQATPPPDKLVPVAIFAHDLWSSCYPVGAEIVWDDSERLRSRFT
jgi:hypothetical protein